MSDRLATYSFLPWLRQGLANQIQSADFDAAVKLRAQVDVQLELRGEKLGGGLQTEAVSRAVALFGPGDIQGIESRAVVRTDPRHWITNFEPNYLAQIEFYDEDFPWRYTPAAPDAASGRLRPWIMLVVLAEGELTEGRNLRNKPLPYVDVADLGLFPPAEQLWAWAHVHVNRSLAGSEAEFTSNDMAAVIPRFQAVLRENPDLAYSRLVCPRKLAENTAYHAFLVPVFESGRLAGLGLDPAVSPNATFSAWAAYPPGAPSPRPEGLSFPYYHRWFFRTGAAGDFESLVRLLQPKPVDVRVGRRDMDVQDPGSNVRGVQADSPQLAGVLKLGGALRVPESSFDPAELEEYERYENWAEPFPRAIQQDLAKLINLADDYAEAAADAANAAAGIPDPEDPDQHDPDPLITPPLYGTWHALTKRLLAERDGSPITPDGNWVHELNLDPRFRVAAGFGTRVVQDQQETLMDAAWEQIGRVLEANRRIRLGQLARETSLIWYDRHLRPLLAVNRQQALLLMAPLNKRVLAAGFTVHHHLGESLVQPAMASTPLRRVLRPRGRLLKAMTFDKDVLPGTLLDRINDGRVSPAPPKVTPPGVVTIDQVADAALGEKAPYQIVREEERTAETLDKLPGSPEFRITEIGDDFVPRPGAADSREAASFKQGLREAYTLFTASREVGAIPPRQRLDLPGLAQEVIAAVHPARTIPRRVMGGIFLPPRVREEIGEPFAEVMAYPEFDLPMYEPLKNLSSELFLPNLNLIAPNSITLLETHQKFIESYMVGLNHEFSRELLWREYPTDQRGSYFRQFWDVRSFFNSEGLDAAALKEKLRDIPPLHRWTRASELGDHDHREAGGESEEEAVLVIRGELLKRYPTAVIYAHRACWQRQGTPAEAANHPCERSGPIDNTRERRLAPLTAAEEANPPRSKVRTPLYEAKVDPDIYFFGFDLTIPEAQGGTGADPDDDPGWFFVIKERPGEPRFGLDVDPQPERNVWNDLSWAEVQPGPPGSYIQVGNATVFTLTPPAPDDEKAAQHGDDVKIAWNPGMSAADLAYILFQAPVLVAVHASEMLPKP